MRGSDQGQVPTIRFEGRQLPARERFAEWDKLAPGYDKILPPGAALEDFEIDCRAWLLEDLVITANRISPIELVRSPAHVLDYARDTYTLVLLKRGQWRADLDYGSIQVGSGQVCIMDFTVPWHVHGAAQDNIMIVLPRTVLNAAAPDAPRLHGRLLEGTSGRLFAEHVLGTPPARTRSTRHAARPQRYRRPALGRGEGAAEALGTAQLVDTGRRDRPRARLYRRASDRPRSQHRADLPRRGRDPGHALPGIPDQQGRRRLYPAPPPGGGACRLSDHADQMSMAGIAELFRFSSAAYFSTAFKRQFGYTPREAKGSVPQARDASALFDAWYETLGADAGDRGHEAPSTSDGSRP